MANRRNYWSRWLRRYTLSIDGDPKKYVEFCEDYYEKEIPLDIGGRIYQGEPISLEMIHELNDELDDEDIKIIKNELEEIKYPNTL